MLYTPPVSALFTGRAAHTYISPHTALRAVVRARYESTTPYSVFLSVLLDGMAGEQEWEVSRETFMESLAMFGHEGGYGDFRTLVTPSGPFRMRFWDPYSPPERKVKLDILVPRHEVAEFIERTLQAVPAGAETKWLDLDARLARLLA